MAYSIMLIEFERVTGNNIHMFIISISATKPCETYKYMCQFKFGGKQV